MAITLNQLLKKSYHGELKCVAGHKGLDKEILGVNVVDNPEIVSWLYGGELILSTGYVTKNNPSMLNTIVKDLHRKGCVGLGFKVKRYFEKIACGWFQTCYRFFKQKYKIYSGKSRTH